MGRGESDKKVSQSTEVLNEDGEERGNWGNQCDFFLSALGYAVGLGNVWRFPFLCYKHGGGAFLIPYALMLLFCGLPLFFLELVLGQYSSLGPNKVFGKLAPAFRGIGYGMLFITSLVAIYYNMIIAWTLFYTFAGFQSQLEWEFCGNDYNTLNCYNKQSDNECKNNSIVQTYWNNTCTDTQSLCNYFNYTEPFYYNETESFCQNSTGYFNMTTVYKRNPPSEDYFHYYMYNLTDGHSWENYGEVRWQLVLSLLLAWIIVCLCLIKGVQSSGKVVYFTALFPYFVLFILLIRGLTLEGMEEGIKFYITPVWSKLEDIEIWSDAATQIFYSLGTTFGGLITMSSYNKFSNNCHRDAILIAFCNCSTSIFAGFVIFSIIGFMAHELNVDVNDVVDKGPGLAFVAYPEAVTKMPISPLWSFLFFAMLITLGLDSQFTMTETLTTAIMDQWPSLRRFKSGIVVLACSIGFVLGLSMCTSGGVFMFTIIDHYSASWSLLILAILEIVLLMYVYGFNKVLSMISEMGMKLPSFMKVYWLSCWLAITPILLIAIVIRSFIDFGKASYKDYVFPDQIQAIGYLMAIGSIILVPAFFIYELVKVYKDGSNDYLSLIRPSSDWGSALFRKQQQSKQTMAMQAKQNQAYDNASFNYDFNNGNANYKQKESVY